MTPLLAFILAVLLLALLASALFSAAEVAIFSIRAPMLEALRRRNEAKAAEIGEVLAQPRKFLAVILLGNVLSSATVALGLTLLCHEITSSRISWWMCIVITTSVLILFGELLPKAVATQRVAPIALGMVGWLRILERATHPFVSYFDHLSQRWVAHFTPSFVAPMHGVIEEEYVALLDIGTREGALRASEKRLIERALQLGDRNLRELMTPRAEMCCLNAEMGLEEMRTEAVSMRHRRLPIYSESPDSIVGILNVKRFLLEPNADISAFIEPPSFVPETMTALNLLKNFLRGPQHMAMVVDEFGGVEGLITLEDLVEEVFGEILDEYDIDRPAWEEIEPRVFVARGSAHLPAISQHLGVDLEADGIDTLGGWITHQMGSLPRAGDRVSFAHYSFQVEKMHRLRVGTVLVRDERRPS